MSVRDQIVLGAARWFAFGVGLGVGLIAAATVVLTVLPVAS